MKQQDEIRLGDMLHAVLKHKLLIITLSICGLVVGIILSLFSYMRGEMSRTYAVTSAIAVTSQTQDGLYTNKERTPNSTDITLAQNMTDSVIYVLRSDKTLNAAIRRVSLVGVSVKDIYNNLTVKKVDSTQIVEMTLYWRNAEEGVEILNAINSVAPGVMSEVLNIGNVSVVNNPKSQYRIGGSVNASMWVLMMALGFAAGCGLCVLEALLRPRLVVAEDLENVFELKVLGEIPEDKKALNAEQPVMRPADAPLLEEKLISTGRILEHEVREETNRCFAVASMSSREGTSTMAACLAYELGETGKKVLLVDLNLRNPMLGLLAGQKPDVYHSLNGLYYGICSPTEPLVHLTRNLDLLPAVIDADKPLRVNDDLMELIGKMAEGYDHVLLDLPPVTLSSDIMAIKNLTDQVVLVARRDKVLMSDLKNGLERLEKAGMRVIGAIANGMRNDVSKDEYRGRRGAGSGRRTAKAPVAESETPVITEVAEDNRVMKNAGLDRKDVIDESVSRSWTE